MTDRESTNVPVAPSPMGWVTAAVCVLVYGLATFVPVPGVDLEVLEAMAPASGGLLGLFNVSAPLVSPFGGMLLLLVVGRAAVRAIAPSPDAPSVLASRIVFALFVLLSMLRGLGMAFYLEAAEAGSEPLVTSPGHAFRLLVVVTFGAAAAVTWFLATRISRTRLAQGPLLLYGGSLVAFTVSDGVQLGAGLATGSIAAWEAMSSVAAVLPVCIVLVTLARRAPARWPLPVARGLVLAGPSDALVFPYLSGLALSSVMLLGPGLALPGSSYLPLVALALGVGLAFALAAWFGRLPARPRVARGYVAGAVLLVPAALLPVAAGVATQDIGLGVMSGALGADGPFAGDGDYEVEVVSSVGAAAVDAPVVSRRLRELAVHADVRPVGRDRLRIELREVRTPEALLDAVLRAREVTFRLVAADQGALTPTNDEEPLPHGVQVQSERFGRDDVRVFVAESRESLDAVLARPGVDRAEVAVECRPFPEDAPRCIAWRLEPAVLRSRDIVEANVQIDPQTNGPYVSIRFSESAGVRFDSLTARSVGRRLAICVDDVVMSAPVIQSRISGGRAQIALGSSQSFEALQHEARVLVAALRSGSLRGEWRASSISVRAR